MRRGVARPRVARTIRPGVELDPSRLQSANGSPDSAPSARAVKVRVAAHEIAIELRRLSRSAPGELSTLRARRKVPRILGSVKDPLLAEQVFGMAIAFPDPQIRSLLVEFVRAWLPTPTASDTLLEMIQDPDDIVCLPAISVAGEEGAEIAIPYLVSITGWPSRINPSPGKPVGMGAAHVHRAMKRLLGYGEKESSHNEAFFQEYGTLPERVGEPLRIPGQKLRDFESGDHPGMTLVRGGKSSHGLAGNKVPDRTFTWEDSTPCRDLWIPPYFIDVFPVTAGDYDRFTQSADALQHATCHPLEPKNKAHIRNTIRDRRFGPNHPATGVDWFDAYSFARASGKELPTEFQWERAARGPSGTVWPWGDRWSASKCNWAGRVFNRASMTLDEWRSHLIEVGPESPQILTLPVDEFPAQNSLGLRDMVGNAWEWTRSESASGRAASPSAIPRGAKTFGVVLKGGSWSSLPGLMYPSYRGRDAMFCRHNEIGFRCVVNIPIAVLREGGLGEVRNTAIY